ncbi:helix-turn-helix transcriptional regulator [Virgibacillus sp. 6R]|uniref:helix-turn-helix transcriptional regulator n=1 Tax=Metabacillus sp. 22489 TaxID=3453928 RepID=UPI0011A93D47
MKKSERLNQMLRFINQKQQFTLRDLMEQFQISKRTAIRDIAALEELGAPIYAEYGRYGGYRLLTQIQLPPISFTNQEIYALYFAMQSLKSFSTIPFQISFQSIHNKFLHELSENQRKEIERMQNRIAFHHIKQIKDSEHLDTLLMAAVKNIVLQITYLTTSKKSTRIIHPIAIYTMKGYWYCQAYDMNKKAYRVFRCDRITSAEATTIQPDEKLIDITFENAHSLWKPSKTAIHFKCLMTNQAGIERFKQEHYPSMKLLYEREGTFLVGSYEANETSFIMTYLAGFGKSIKIIEPVKLKEDLRQYYLDLIEHL